METKVPAILKSFLVIIVFLVIFNCFISRLILFTTKPIKPTFAVEKDCASKRQPHMLEEVLAKIGDLTLDQRNFRKRKHAATSCALWQFPDRVQKNEKPTIILNSNRYLYPGLVGGPSNQAIGLLDAVYLAITLNR